jgi:uncharacterized membrane-anchored protein
VLTLTRRHAAPLPGVCGPARVDRDPLRLAQRLRPGDIAVIDRADLDQVAADALVASGAAAVVNAAMSITGRYPTPGPRRIVAAGVPLIDEVGRAALETIRDGTRVRVDGDTVYDLTGRVLAVGISLDPGLVEAQLRAADAGLSAHLQAFASSTAEYVRREQSSLFDGAGIPRLRTPIAGRPVLVVLPGGDAAVRGLRRFIRQHRPVCIVVGDAPGVRPDVIVSDPFRLSADATASGAEIVLRIDPDARYSATATIDQLRDRGTEPVLYRSAGDCADLALLLADGNGASLIVRAGPEESVADLLDRGGSRLASTVFTRLRVGGRLVDAGAVARLHPDRTSWFALAALAVAAVALLAIAMAITPAHHLSAHLYADQWHRFVRWLRHTF